MGDMYRINLSALPPDVQKEYHQTIEKYDGEIFFTEELSDYEIDVFWKDPENIHDALNLPKGCTITKRNY